MDERRKQRLLKNPGKFCDTPFEGEKPALRGRKKEPENKEREAEGEGGSDGRSGLWTSSSGRRMIVRCLWSWLNSLSLSLSLFLSREGRDRGGQRNEGWNEKGVERAASERTVKPPFETNRLEDEFERWLREGSKGQRGWLQTRRW